MMRIMIRSVGVLKRTKPWSERKFTAMREWVESKQENNRKAGNNIETNDVLQREKTHGYSRGEREWER